MLQRTALITSLTGIMLLLVLSQYLEPKTRDISEINNKMLEQWVKVNGTITQREDSDGMIIIELASNDEKNAIKVVIYGNLAQSEGLEKGVKAEVVGKVIEYYGKLEIEASKIKIL